jgi:hypothetical protein
VRLAPFPYRDADRMVFPRIYDTRQEPEIWRQGYERWTDLQSPLADATVSEVRCAATCSSTTTFHLSRRR